MKGLLIIGHGSRSAEAVREFESVVDMVRQKSDFAKVLGAHMELAQPDIPTAVKQLADAGALDITVVPYFLFMGNHIKHDIPGILDSQRALYPSIQFQFAKPIGAEALMADILIKRAAEVEESRKS